MKAIIIAFTVMNGNQKKANEFCKKFYGQETSCQNGKYRYRRKGLLDDIPHIKLIRGVIIFREEDAKKITNFLKSYSADFYIRKIEATKDDIKSLRK